MAARTSSPGRRPLNEKSLNFDQAADDFSVTSSRWFSLRSRSSARKMSADSETEALDMRSRLVVVMMPTTNDSLTCLLTQVCGGPLESVFLIRAEPRPLVLLEFIQPCHAERFYAYAQQGNCVLNGQTVTVCEPSIRHLTNMVSKSKQHQPSKHRTAPTFARRTLQIFKPFPLLSSNYNFRWEQQPPQLVRSRVDIRCLAEIFGQLGRVVQVRPMLFQQSVAFAVDFDCVASAVNAKACFDKERCAARHRDYSETQYFSSLEGWYLEYARDPTERACLI